MKHLLLLFLIGTATLPALALAPDRPQAYPLDPEAATRAVLAAHPELAGDSMELATRILLREPAPLLQAGSLERAGEQGRVRVRCQAETACLPFYVLVHLTPAQAPSPRQMPAFSAGNPPVLRSGDRTSMVIDSGLLHLRLPVTCLQSGAAGSSIRVMGPARGKVYEAAVIDRTTVRGNL